MVDCLFIFYWTWNFEWFAFLYIQCIPNCIENLWQYGRVIVHVHLFLFLIFLVPDCASGWLKCPIFFALFYTKMHLSGPTINFSPILNLLYVNLNIFSQHAPMPDHMSRCCIHVPVGNALTVDALTVWSTNKRIVGL